MDLALLGDRDIVIDRYRRVRGRTQALAEPLSAEDMAIQSMPDASPTKWHLGHTTWFFAEFALARFDPSFRWDDERWRVLFNSYYEAAGPRHPRPSRGLLSRPSLGEVIAWRAHVDDRMLELLARGGADVLSIALLGTHHEEQHQELVLTDIKHALAQNPLRPAYARGPARPSAGRASGSRASSATNWRGYDERIASIGVGEGEGQAAFAFDSERPRHRVLVGAFDVAPCLVTNDEYAAFVREGGYTRPDLWLSDGWAAVVAGGWEAPLYWTHEGRSEGDGEWTAFTLHGPAPIDGAAPVEHVSFYEADAYARWAGARLPTEGEWEVVAAEVEVNGNFAESGLLAPEPAPSPTDEGRSGVTQLFGDVWEWTASAYSPYPRFRPLAGALGEYNGKFMSGQMVLRGGSCLSPRDHLRATYRNFFPPSARWQSTGIRLARDP